MYLKKNVKERGGGKEMQQYSNITTYVGFIEVLTIYVYILTFGFIICLLFIYIPQQAYVCSLVHSFISYLSP